jgi:hypothetical protein
VFSQRPYELLMRDGRLWKLAEIAKSLKREGRRALTLTGREKLECSKGEGIRECVPVVLKLAPMGADERAVHLRGRHMLTA